MPSLRGYLGPPDAKHQLRPGAYTLGRAAECDVVISSGRCSRKQACLVVEASGATLEDLGSANGTFVNGVRITGPHSLADGDFVVIGGEVGLEVLVEPDPTAPAPREQAQSVDAVRDGSPYLPPTTRVRADEVLESVADHLIAKGQPEQAERALSGWLQTALAAAERGRWREDAVADVSLRCAAKLAQALPSRRWVDYALRLATALSRPVGAEAGRLLGEALGRAGVSAHELERYVARLRALPASPDVARALGEAETWRALVRESRS